MRCVALPRACILRDAFMIDPLPGRCPMLMPMPMPMRVAGA